METPIITTLLGARMLLEEQGFKIFQFRELNGQFWAEPDTQPRSYPKHKFHSDCLIGYSADSTTRIELGLVGDTLVLYSRNAGERDEKEYPMNQGNELPSLQQILAQWS